MLKLDKDYRIVTPEEFDRCFDASHEELEGAKYCYVNDRTVDDYRDCTCILFMDGEGTPEAYAAVDPDGVIGSVLKDRDSKKRQFLLDILYVAIGYGGSKLDCYKDDQSTLPYSYADAGFMPVCRIPFDRSQVEGEWSNEAGTPDVVFMFFMDGGVTYDTYKEKVLKDRYPRLADYGRIPYTKDLAGQFPEHAGDDPYTFAQFLRDYAAEKWETMKDDFRGRETEFIRSVFL